MEAQTIIKALGRSEVAAALGVAEKTVIDHVSRGVFPAAWFAVIRGMSEKAGVPCDERLFSFKRGVEA